jgi:pyrroloquinoline quinone (PQQ) biosynthesis protein C
MAFVFTIGSCSLVQEQENAMTHPADINTAINIQEQLTLATYLNEKSIRQKKHASQSQNILNKEDLLSATSVNLEHSFKAPRLKRAEGQNIVYHYGSPLCQLDIYFAEAENERATPAFFKMRQVHTVKNAKENGKETSKEGVTLKGCLLSLHKSLQTAQK